MEGRVKTSHTHLICRVFPSTVSNTHQTDEPPRLPPLPLKFIGHISVDAWWWMSCGLGQMNYSSWRHFTRQFILCPTCSSFSPFSPRNHRWLHSSAFSRMSSRQMPILCCPPTSPSTWCSAFILLYYVFSWLDRSFHFFLNFKYFFYSSWKISTNPWALVVEDDNWERAWRRERVQV